MWLASHERPLEPNEPARTRADARLGSFVPHVGGRYAPLEWHDPELEPLVDGYSEWGEFEWFLKEALEKGYRVGFTAGSDDHKGRPGAAYPGSGSFGVYGGLTCIQAESLTREGLWMAIRARRCYGTTGQRILIDATADGHPMGSAFEAEEAPEIVVHVVGTAPIERIDVFRGLEEVYSYPEAPERSEDRVRLAWSGPRIRARDAMMMHGLSASACSWRGSAPQD